MALSRTRQRIFGTQWLFHLAIVFVTLGTWFSIAIPTVQGQLTVDLLIGNSVSLSNRSYPEVESAIQRFRNGDLKSAQEFLDIAQKKYPKLPPSEVIMAKMHSAARYAPGVRIMLELAVKHHPKDPEAYLMLADQAFGGRRTAEAEALFEKASRLVPDFKSNEKRKRDFTVRILIGGAAVAERRQQWDRAQRFLEKWVEAKPDSDIAYQRLGNTLFQLEKPTEALQNFEKARQINPDAVHPSIALGRLFAHREDMENARKHFVKAYQEEKSNEVTSQAYAEWLLQQGENKAARKVTAAMRDIKPDSASAWLTDGIVALLGEDIPQAEQSLSKVLSIDHSNATATNLLALLLIRSDNPAQQERALSYAKVNADRFPKSSQANITLASVLYKVGRPQEAKVALSRGASAGNLSVDSTYLIARIMAKENQADKAITALEKLLKTPNTNFFMHRKEAGELLEKLKSEVKQ